MTRPMPLETFTRLPPLVSVDVVDGLSGAIDAVAAQAKPSHRFLRYGWFAAALAAYGGQARTLIAARDGAPAAALPIVARGPAALGLAAVPGCYWPFRSFPVREDVGIETVEVLLARLAREVTALRIGPVYDGDPGLELVKQAASARGWAVLDRFVADSWLLDIGALRAEGEWPRGSTLKKNRYFEKQLAGMGDLDWAFVTGDGWDEPLLAELAAIEAKSWVTERAGGSDAKFTRGGHGAFWRAAASDPGLAAMLSIALLRVGGVPAAFSFDLDSGDLKYAVANSYDPAFAKHSPGKILYYRNLQHGLARGFTRVDWGAGDSGYKGVIGAGQGPAIRDWLFVRPGAVAGIAGMLRGLWRRSGQG